MRKAGGEDAEAGNSSQRIKLCSKYKMQFLMTEVKFQVSWFTTAGKGLRVLLPELELTLARSKISHGLGLAPERYC